MRLEDIKSPQDIKGLSYAEMNDLAAQIRTELVTTISKRGGHLASNLGVVELTMAIHRVFNMPEDKIVFDVGHQSYVHKLLTGRYRTFCTLRSFGGMSGFPKRSESEYDVFETGHASTALSAALGLARARDLQGQHHHVLALVGDGAMTGGMCYEALNDAGDSHTRMIVILNDNEMSIAPNVGALSQHLTDLRVSSGWTSTKRVIRKGLSCLPVVGKPLQCFYRGQKRASSPCSCAKIKRDSSTALASIISARLTGMTSRHWSTHWRPSNSWMSRLLCMCSQKRIWIQRGGGQAGALPWHAAVLCGNRYGAQEGNAAVLWAGNGGNAVRNGENG